MRDLEDEKRIKEYMKAKMTHIKMYNECMNLVDGLDVEKFAELVRADEREKIAQKQKAFVLDRGCWERGCVAYDEHDGDGVNISAERVDETAKCKRKWVGLTEDEALDLLPVGEWEVEPTLVFAKAIEDRLKDMNT